MHISAIGSASATSSGAADTSGTIAKLQKQIEQLTIALKDLASSDMEAKAKLLKSKLLQGMIQMLQQQIAALQRQSQQAQALKQQVTQAQPSASVQRKASQTVGTVLDTFA